jgi:sugar transferase (PEP-CTERM system associated)
MKVFRHTVAAGARTGMLADVVLCFAAILVAASTLTSRYATVPGAVPELPLILFGASFFALVMAMMYAVVGLYRPAPIRAGDAIARTIFALIVGGYLTNIALRVVADRGYVEQLIAAAMVYLGIGLVFVRASMQLMRHVAPLSRVLIVGTGPEAQSIAQALKGPGGSARDVVGMFPTCDESDGDECIPPAAATPRIFDRNSSIKDLVSRFDIQEIIVAVREQRGGGVPMDQLLACRIGGVPVLDMAGFCERTRGEVPIDSLKGSWLVYGHGFVQGQMRMAVKRGFDIVISLLVLVLLSPLMLLTMIAIMLDSAGPIFYRQVRVGLGGRDFVCMKFRSLRTDAEHLGVARWAVRNDPRHTPLGAFIRKTRIDELPQLFSVLSGEMSLVGPRPERPSFVSQLQKEIPFYDIRHTVKPGITGWAQVRFHYGATLEDARRKHQFDLYYVKNNSLFLDILVLIETVSVVIFREGQ